MRLGSCCRGGAKGYLGSAGYAVVQRGSDAAVLIVNEGMRL